MTARFEVQEDRLAYMFEQVRDEDEPVTLDYFGGEEIAVQMCGLVAFAWTAGAIGQPQVGGAPVEPVLYADDDGFIAAVRPLGAPSYYGQIASVWQEACDYRDITLDGEKQIRSTLALLVEELNRLTATLDILERAVR